MHLAYLNLLWILFALFGLGVFGAFPATSSIFALLRQEMKNGIAPTFKSFFKYFKKDFWKANLLGWILMFVACIVYIDFKMITYLETDIKMFFYFSLLIVAIIALFVAFYLFPVYVHYDLEIKRYFLISLIIIFTYPIQSILTAVVSLLNLYIMLNFPGLIPFFGMSLWAFCVSHISRSVFSDLVT